MENSIYYLSNTNIPNTKRENNKHVFNVFTQVGVKQLTDFLRTVTAASDLVDCTLVNCGPPSCEHSLPYITHAFHITQLRSQLAEKR